MLKNYASNGRKRGCTPIPYCTIPITAQVSKFVAGKQFDKILTKERVGKILEGGLVCKILEQRGPEQGGACLVPFNIIKGFIGRISFPRLYVFPHSFRRA